MNKLEVLKKYEELMEMGAISREEYEQKKAELMIDEEAPAEENVAEEAAEPAEETVEEPESEETAEETVAEPESEEPAEETAEEPAEETPAKSVLEKINWKKWAKFGLVAVLLLCLLKGMVSCSLTNLAVDDSMVKKTIHGMEYSIADVWETVEEESGDTMHVYELYDGATEPKAIMTVEYAGESDLYGEAAYEEDDEETDEEESFDYPKTMSDINTVTETEVEADAACFKVSLYYAEGNVKGVEECLTLMADNFNTEEYVNPRKSLGVTINYDGDTEAGTVIDSECEDLTVYEEFDTGIAKGRKDYEWTVENSVTLKAGETSTVKIGYNGKIENLKVKCTSLTEAQYKGMCEERNYKDQLRNESYFKFIKISGKVLQDCGSGCYRISSDGAYDDVYMVITKDADIVEDDWVTVYGMTSGIYEYETVLGASKKIPSIVAEYVER